MLRMIVAALIAALALSPIVARSQAYPTKPIRFVISFGPGSASDALARIAGQELSQSMGQLILFRAVQGLGAGSILTMTVTIIGDLYTLEQRARMQGLFASVWGITSIVGPIAGGAITRCVKIGPGRAVSFSRS